MGQLLSYVHLFNTNFYQNIVQLLRTIEIESLDIQLSGIYELHKKLLVAQKNLGIRESEYLIRQNKKIFLCSKYLVSFSNSVLYTEWPLSNKEFNYQTSKIKHKFGIWET